MKLTKDSLKKIILEEMSADKALLDSLGELSTSIENLEVSIDFLAAIFTGESGVSIGAAQRQLGRAYRPKVQRMPQRELDELRARVKQMIREELEVVLTNEEVGEIFGADVREELEAIEERELSKSEKKEKEKVVKGMKKSKSDFKRRYGDDAESVMYATATKIAKEKK